MQYHVTVCTRYSPAVEQLNQHTVKARLTILSNHHTQLTVLMSHWAPFTLTVVVQEGRNDSIEYSAVMYLEMYSQIVSQLSVGNEHDKSFKMNLTENFELQRRSTYKPPPPTIWPIVPATDGG
jgi:hypothetical protein